MMLQEITEPLLAADGVDPPSRVAPRRRGQNDAQLTGMAFASIGQRRSLWRTYSAATAHQPSNHYQSA